MNIKDVAWPDVKAKLDKSNLLIVPLGATETYGHHLAMGTEIAVADYVGNELGNRLDCLVTPTIPVTCSALLDPFPGNLYASPPVVKAYVQEICDRMVTWGIRRIFFLNIHGPNLGFLDELSREYMRRQIRCSQVDFWRTMIKLVPDLLRGPAPHAYGHGSEMAVAVALAINPALVFRDRFSTVIPDTPLADKYPDIMTYVAFNEVTPTGHTGDPSLGTVAAGREALKRTLDRLEQFLRAWS
ncbi:MAG TPA: creatininase family protein [Candidatus Sulfotelmatobacter sp.]|nr:creatininase family protein [Candidatus Sulfotelmatobacter sp.]